MAADRRPRGVFVCEILTVEAGLLAGKYKEGIIFSCWRESDSMLIPQEQYGSVIVPFNRKNHLVRSVEAYVLLDAGGLGQWRLLLSACVRLCCAETETEGFRMQ